MPHETVYHGALYWAFGAMKLADCRVRDMSITNTERMTKRLELKSAIERVIFHMQQGHPK